MDYECFCRYHNPEFIYDRKEVYRKIDESFTCADCIEKEMADPCNREKLAVELAQLREKNQC